MTLLPGVGCISTSLRFRRTLVRLKEKRSRRELGARYPYIGVDWARHSALPLSLHVQKGAPVLALSLAGTKSEEEGETEREESSTAKAFGRSFP